MKKICVVCIGFLALNFKTSFAQNHGITTCTTLAYSGVSQAVRYSYEIKDWTFAAGPKYNFSKSRTIGKSIPGVSLQADFHPYAQGKFFVLYELLPQKVVDGKSQIHELYGGYGFKWLLKEHFTINTGIGIGLYVERGNIIQKYQLQGLSYCSNIALGYRF